MLKFSDIDGNGRLSKDELVLFFNKGLGLDKRLSELLTLATMVKGDVDSSDSLDNQGKDHGASA